MPSAAAPVRSDAVATVKFCSVCPPKLLVAANDTPKGKTRPRKVLARAAFAESSVATDVEQRGVMDRVKGKAGPDTIWPPGTLQIYLWSLKIPSF